MKLLRTEITPLINNALYLEFREQPFLSSLNQTQAIFHEHPELQLTFIIEGSGKRIIGNQISDFESGDMVFLGSNVPHIWISDSSFYQEKPAINSKVITVYINPKIFHDIFDQLEEMKQIEEMLQQATKGIHIYGETRKVIADKLIALSSKTGFERVDGILQIMNIIATSPHKRYIINNEPNNFDDQHYSDRLLLVLSYIKDNIRENVSLEQVAEVACMTVSSFCRFFKNRMKKTFSQYLVELRMDEASKLLIRTDKSISEITYLCGFNSDSHFCKVFKQHFGISPYQYKKTFLTKKE